MTDTELRYAARLLDEHGIGCRVAAQRLGICERRIARWKAARWATAAEAVAPLSPSPPNRKDTT